MDKNNDALKALSRRRLLGALARRDTPVQPSRRVAAATDMVRQLPAAGGPGNRTVSSSGILACVTSFVTKALIAGSFRTLAMRFCPLFIRSSRFVA